MNQRTPNHTGAQTGHCSTRSIWLMMLVGCVIFGFIQDGLAVPVAPGNVVASVVWANQINLTWQHGGSVSGFKIQRANSAGGPWTQIAQVSGNVRIYRNAPLFNSMTYYYQVAAYDSTGNSPYTSSLGATTPDVFPVSVLTWGSGGRSGLSNAVAASAGGMGHCLVLRQDGIVVAWGDNSYGQAEVPSGLSNVISIAAGNGHSLAVKEDMTVVAWGSTWTNQVGPLAPAIVPPGLTGVVAVAAGADNSLALKADGTVVAWGIFWTESFPYYNPVYIPSGLSNVVAIACGETHNLALKSDGTVIAWGMNYYGQTNVPPGVTNVVAIAAGASHSCALRADGTVVSWGMYYDSNIGYLPMVTPAGVTNLVALAGAGWHNLGLRNDGSVISWGDTAGTPLGLSNVVAIAGVYWGGLAIGDTCSLTAFAVASGSWNEGIWYPSETPSNSFYSFHVQIPSTTVSLNCNATINSLAVGSNGVLDITSNFTLGVTGKTSVAGSVNLSAGALKESESLIVGSCVSNIIGNVLMSGGSLLVTNSTATASLDVRNGTLVLTGGVLRVDRLILTNSCGHIDWDGTHGTMLVGEVILDPLLDADGDGLPNNLEALKGSNPLVSNPDIDGDGIPNAWELTIGSDPYVNDANGDSDHDGLTNLQEYQLLSTVDSDGDGMPNNWELSHGLNPFANDSSEDRDLDGLSNLQEYQLGLYPEKADSLGDGKSDYERVYGQMPVKYYYDKLDRLVATDYNHGSNGLTIAYLYDRNGNILRQGHLRRNLSGDGVSDWWKFANGLSVTNANAYEDSDSDGWSNFQEWKGGSNPLDTNSVPINPPQSAPTAVVMLSTNTLANFAVVTTRLWDAEGNASTPYLQYQVAGSTNWQDAALVLLDGAPYSTNSRVAALPGGANHITVWNALANLGANVTTNILLRARAQDVTLLGEWSGGAPFTVQTTVNPDSDNDGIPDAWEMQYFGNLSHNGLTDSDGDGFSDLVEYTADTNPTNNLSYLHFSSVRSVPGGIAIIWQGGNLSTQYLQQNFSLNPTSIWTDIFTNLPPTANPSGFTNNGLTNNAGFYRIRVTR